MAQPIMPPLPEGNVFTLCGSGRHDYAYMGSIIRRDNCYEVRVIVFGMDRDTASKVLDDILNTQRR